MTCSGFLTDARVESVARSLFPNETPVTDCYNEVGAPGQSCRICTAHNEHWEWRLQTVRAALAKAFA